MKTMMKCFAPALILAAVLIGIPAHAGQVTAQTRPAFLGVAMPDFKLPAVQGGEYSVSGLRGKNILLIFPRGKVDDHWCQICHYQYAELVELEKSLDLRRKYNLEILFVLPYDRATVEHWVAILPDQLKLIDEWKNPAEPGKLDEKRKAKMERSKLLFPKTILPGKDGVSTPFPILIDADHAVSSGLGLFTQNWGGSAVDQNIPAVYLIDAKGNLRLKYVSQNTIDRPPFEDLIEFMDKMLITK